MPSCCQYCNLEVLHTKHLTRNMWGGYEEERRMMYSLPLLEIVGISNCRLINKLLIGVEETTKSPIFHK